MNHGEIAIATRHFAGAGLDLAADVAGASNAPPVVFLHGGGQTRGSWGKAVERVARAGFRGISLDLRGHGESGWAADGDYSLDRLADDLRAVLSSLDQPAFLVGASLGGLTALLVTENQSANSVRGLVLVDVVPQLESKGADRIRAFMRTAPEGFASLNEAADAVALYLPHRPRPKDPSGLRKNLRMHEDGRYRWHWDPRFFFRAEGVPAPSSYQPRLEAIARTLRIPTLLVRGDMSEIVSPEGARSFLELAPHAEFVDVKGARHMVAGDVNDAFNEAILSFLNRHTPEKNSTADCREPPRVMSC